jgi:hypothetical protein
MKVVEVVYGKRWREEKEKSTHSLADHGGARKGEGGEKIRSR